MDKDKIRLISRVFVALTVLIIGSFLIAFIGCGGGGGDDDDENGNTTPTECQDTIDNDSDGWVDADDPDCTGGTTEIGLGLTECNDGADNDSDGDIDSADANCLDALDDESVPGTLVGVAGGTVTSGDGNVSLVIPAGALSGDTSIAIVPLPTIPSGGIGTSYRFTPEGTTFTQPVAISFVYDELDIPNGLDESSITLATFVNSHQWREMVGGSVDTIANTVTGNTYGFSTYGLKIGFFEASLSGSQVVPSSASAATGTALISIDYDTNILAYNISLDGLEGAETSAAIHGPAIPGATATALITLVPGNPKVGIWKYDESLEANLLSGEMYVRINSDLFMNGEIRGQIVPAGSSVSPSDVTVRIHQWDDLAGNGPVTGIPALIDSVDISISAPDIATLSQSASLSSGNIEESFSVTKGGSRQVEALAYDASNQLLYSGYAYVDIVDKAHVVNLSMIDITDSTPPTFTGIASAQKISGDAVTLDWSAATDNTASSTELYYLVYVSKTSGGHNFSTPSFVTDPGDTVFTINGLAAGTTYYFVVRSMDPAGNIDANSVEVSAATFSNGTGLYVDVNTGTDDANCGDSDNPCRTITYALTKTAGNENIYIAKGVYDTTSGESFPLALKTGTALLGDLVFVQVLPTTTGNVLRGTLLPATLIRIADTTMSSAILGEDGTYIGGIIVDYSQSNISYAAVEGTNKSMFINQSAFYGVPDGVTVTSGVNVGGGSTIKHSLFSDFVQSAIYSYGGSGTATISHNTVKNSGIGINTRYMPGSHIFRNRVINNTFGIIPGSDSLVFLNDITKNYTGIEQPGSGTMIQSNTILNNDESGIQIVSAEDMVDPVVISNNWIANNGSVGIRILNHGGNALINGNVIVCNTLDLFVDRTDFEIDMKHNKWDHNPPTIFDYNESDLCDNRDLCYTGTYAGTPAPIYLPTSGTDTCPGRIAIMPPL
jgi:CHRD domain/Protein of unknown function (DUF1565)/Periplasmic copper-binding protein (NosD)